jgi:hypothetical protein
MDNTDSKRKPNGEGQLNEDRDIFKLMVDEAMQSFFQRENFVRSLDTKSFGVVSINAILFAIFLYVKTIIQTEFLCVPYGLLIASLILIAMCIWPHEWDRQDSKITIEKYGGWEFKCAATQLAINYATWDYDLKEIYSKKMFYFEFGLILSTAAFISEIFIFIYFSF